ncbi:hypothetical protein [Nonomuraea gerenzanensis]|uniref:Permeases of the major facilitator superfamily n=1 Tax=Nonomuraea gerenzanensis TaxID=93944 RepID=A0A1M4ED04_9ACTN|nr:Permeases of the major facilitator superfamily [Nonomuraea gerenzanensis]
MSTYHDGTGRRAPVNASVAPRVRRLTGSVPVSPPSTAMWWWPWWDLPGRAAATAVLVVTLTTAAGALGPQATGVLAPFPIATSVLTAFVLAQRGPAAAVQVLRGIPQGLIGFAVFCVLAALLIEPWGVGAGFALATVGTLTVQLTWQRLAGRYGLTARDRSRS